LTIQTTLAMPKKRSFYQQNTSSLIVVCVAITSLQILQQGVGPLPAQAARLV